MAAAPGDPGAVSDPLPFRKEQLCFCTGCDTSKNNATHWSLKEQFDQKYKNVIITRTQTPSRQKHYESTIKVTPKMTYFLLLKRKRDI